MTLSARPASGGRHLSLVPDLLDAAKSATQSANELNRMVVGYATRGPATSPAPPRVPLKRSAQLDLDQAELFLLSLDGELRTDGPRAAYLLGLAEGHLANVLEIVRGLTGPVTGA